MDSYEDKLRKFVRPIMEQMFKEAPFNPSAATPKQNSDRASKKRTEVASFIKKLRDFKEDTVDLVTELELDSKDTETYRAVKELALSLYKFDKIISTDFKNITVRT